MRILLCREERKDKGTYPRDIRHSVDGNLLLTVQPFPIFDGPASQRKSSSRRIQTAGGLNRPAV